MTKVNYPATSAYALTPQSNFSIGLYRHRKIPANVTDEYKAIDAKYHHRPDLLAADLYGHSGLYWVFMVRNLSVIRDPFWDFVSGLMIYRPTVETLRKNIGI